MSASTIAAAAVAAATVGNPLAQEPMTSRAPGQDQQSDHWNGEDEAQRDLAQDERPSRVDAERHDRKSGRIVTSRRSQSGMR